jgi:class 3 adenylate cyclase
VAELPAQRRWSLRFVDPEVEARFQEERAPLARRRLRVILPPLVALWFGAFWFDLAAPSGMAGGNAFFRFGVGGPMFIALGIFLFVARDATFARWWHALMTLTYATLLGACVGLNAVAVDAFRPHALIGFVIVLVIGGGLALIELRWLLITTGLGAVGVAAVLLGKSTSSFDASAYMTWVVVAEVAVVLLAGQLESFQRRLFLQRALVDRERARTETLLLNVMPKPIADRLKRDPEAIADHFDAITVVFADIVGFTSLAAMMSPQEVVARLDSAFSRIDDIVNRHGLEKIKTIGDQYMAVAGAPVPRPDHAEAAARVALEICAIASGPDGLGGLTFRVGVASGPAVAGVIGKSRFSYDLWGDTVNLASRMESHGVPGKIQIDEHTRDLLHGQFLLEDRGMIDVKGKGTVHTYFLLGEAN